jgi:hypothetical protein
MTTTAMLASETASVFDSLRLVKWKVLFRCRTASIGSSASGGMPLKDTTDIATKTWKSTSVSDDLEQKTGVPASHTSLIFKYELEPH